MTASTGDVDLRVFVWLIAGAAFATLVVVGRRNVQRRIRRRRRELAAFARSNGLRFGGSPRDLPAFPPVTLIATDVGAPKEGVWGVWRARSSIALGYLPYDGPSGVVRGCAATNVSASLPYCRIVAGDEVTAALESLGLPDIEFESDEFNAAFLVRSGDEYFARALIDARMMDWLLDEWPAMLRRGIAFEMDGPWVLCRSMALWGAAVAEELLESVTRFADAIPRVVYDLYGPGATG